jgi:hypothetical protein
MVLSGKSMLIGGGKLGRELNMKTNTARNTALALLGLLALTIYILACTSFSPDDTKILYPSFDRSGAVGIAVYDRETRRSEMLFLPLAYQEGLTNSVVSSLVRSQWLPDGRQILLSWIGGKDQDDHELSLAVMPLGGHSPFRLYHLPGVKSAGTALMLPLCVSRDQVFVMQDSETVIRLNFKSGEITRRELGGIPGELHLYPAPSGDAAFYVMEQRGTNSQVVFGRLDPEALTLKPLATITNTLADGSFFAYNAQGTRVAFVERDEPDRYRLVVLKNGKPDFARSLGAKGQNYRFGNGVLSPRGDMIWASFQLMTEGQKGRSYGLMEIPLSSAPVQITVLIANSEADEEMGALYFQVGVSHDGKTVAAASTYLACTKEEFKAEDCGLFFVDLSDPRRKVTKLPIPMPAKRSNPAGL